MKILIFFPYRNTLQVSDAFSISSVYLEGIIATHLFTQKAFIVIPYNYEEYRPKLPLILDNQYY